MDTGDSFWVEVYGCLDNGDFFWIDEDGTFHHIDEAAFEWLEVEGCEEYKDSFEKGE